MPISFPKPEVMSSHVQQSKTKDIRLTVIKTTHWGSWDKYMSDITQTINQPLRREDLLLSLSSFLSCDIHFETLFVPKNVDDVDVSVEWAGTNINLSTKY